MNDILLGLSICRNPKLANIFYRLQLIEAYGTGMLKILRAYEPSGKKPRIETSDNAFKITLPNLHGTAGAAAPENDMEDLILQYVADHEAITRWTAQEVTGLGQTAAGRLLKGMVAKRLLAPAGQGKNTKYIKQN